MLTSSNTEIKKKRNLSEPMDVTFNVNLNQIVDLSEKEQSLLLSLAEFEVPNFSAGMSYAVCDP